MHYSSPCEWLCLLYFLNKLRQANWSVNHNCNDAELTSSNFRYLFPVIFYCVPPFSILRVLNCRIMLKMINIQTKALQKIMETKFGDKLILFKYLQNKSKNKTT